MARSKVLQEYFDALHRLQNNKPVIVPVGTGINKDTVALEAGRARGSIKKSRLMFSELIEEIDNINKKIKEPKINEARLKDEISSYKELYENALARELMYIERINELEKIVKKYTLNVTKKL